MTALLALVREELGEEAVIVATRTWGESGMEVEVELSDNEGIAGALRASEAQLEPVITLATPYEPLCRAARRSLVEEELLAQGLAAPLARLLGERTDPRDETERALAHELEKVIEFDVRLPLERRVIGFFGATGVGKTTTIAKLAAQLQRVCRLKVGLVCADTYRVGASFQLKAYASLLGTPFRCLASEAKHERDLGDAVADLAHCDVVLVDFPGVSARDTGRIEMLAQQCVGAEALERILVLSAPSNTPDLSRVVRAFAPLEIGRVIITKLDESGYIGPVINTVAAFERPVAFLTAGQRVPEDIEPASARRLAWLLRRPVQ
jgi:flagellar biosynthesis protein FlhF